MFPRKKETWEEKAEPSHNRGQVRTSLSFSLTFPSHPDTTRVRAARICWRERQTGTRCLLLYSEASIPPQTWAGGRDAIKCESTFLLKINYWVGTICSNFWIKPQFAKIHPISLWPHWIRRELELREFKVFLPITLQLTNKKLRLSTAFPLLYGTPFKK